jgi:excisionase family DNA binding protein
MDDVIGTKEASEILSITQRHIIRLIQNGELIGKQIGKQWAISRVSVLEYKTQKETQEQKEKGRQ